jgi:hypothetical protein
MDLSKHQFYANHPDLNNKFGSDTICEINEDDEEEKIGGMAISSVQGRNAKG